MKGYCVVVTKAYKYKSSSELPVKVSPKPIFDVFLIEAEEDVHAVDTIKEHCRQAGCLPWLVDHWDKHQENISWFVVRDFKRLATINWPIVHGDRECALLYEAKMYVYRAFEIKQVTLDQALNTLDLPVITRAQGLGWKPRELKYALYDLTWAMDRDDQAEAYRESVMAMTEDVPTAVQATESIYEQDALKFLEKLEKEEEEENEPKALEDMTDEELIKEATQLHRAIYITANCWGIDDLFRLRTLTAELFDRSYEVHTGASYAGTSYSVQKLK